MNYDDAIARLNDAAKRLCAKGLLQPEDTLSMRLAGCDNILLQTGSGPAQRVDIVPVTDGAVAGPLAAQHLAVYRARPDVGCVLLNRQPWACALHALARDMPGVFDEQIRHLGRSVALLDGPVELTANQARLQNGANAWVAPGHVLCFGTLPERTVFNAELLEKCAKAYVLATSAGLPVGRIPWLVRWIANGRLLKDERRAAEQYAMGQTPVLSTAY
ncbi:class II aldolase/adducin family protein [Duganella sp.]|uniref:class II aldolase/adducin family protein n=1 Tax=Duganella sp. TaxID=1904440 RepID=UPI0031D10FB2